MRMTINQYLRDYFAPGSAPTKRTVKNRIQRGDIWGVLEGTWYVDPDRSPNEQPANNNALRRLPPELQQIAAGVLEKLRA